MRDQTYSMLLTDLYEITMAAAFFENDFNPVATFELFVRRLPKDRGYLIAAGLEHALSWVQRARFTEEDIEYVRNHPAFHHVSEEFFDCLRSFRFSGDIWAVPEGTVVFAEEPIVRVTAPLIQAQLLETYLLSAITFPTMIATKASRVAAAAQGRQVIEFGARRAHGPEAGVLAARAAYIGGCRGTSNVEAGCRFGIPTFGTMAHSFIMAMKDEGRAFGCYSKLFPDTSVLLIDTYDTLHAVDKIVTAGLRPAAVRIDSGDLAQVSREVRKRLDAAGLHATRIFLSGDLDEFKVASLLEQGTPADGFGVGTALVVSSDAPSLGGIYKLVEIQNGGKKTYHAKFSAEKMTYPGAKQVYRFRDGDGRFTYDVIACSGEHVLGGEPLLSQIVRHGKLLTQSTGSLQAIRDRAQVQLESLSPAIRKLTRPARYEVQFTSELKQLLEGVRREQSGRQAVER